MSFEPDNAVKRLARTLALLRQQSIIDPFATRGSPMNDTETKRGRPRKASAVQMSDGRTVQFIGKQKTQRQSLFDPGGQWVYTRFDFRDGRTITYTAPPPELKTTSGESMLQRLAALGAEHTIGIEALRKPTIDKAYAAVAKCVENLRHGQWYWKVPKSAAPADGFLSRAIADHTRKPIESIETWLAGRNNDEVKALKHKFKDAIRRLEDAAALQGQTVDADALMTSIPA
jgi:hypothetical protein